MPSSRSFYIRAPSDHLRRVAVLAFLRRKRNVDPGDQPPPSTRNPPTFVAEYGDVWNTNTTPKTASTTVGVGDILAVMGASEDADADHLQTPTGGGLTYTLQNAVEVSAFTTAYGWTAPSSSSQTFTLSVSTVSGVAVWGFSALRFSGSDGVGATAKDNVSGAAPTLNITTQQDSSALVVIIGDWNAVDGASRTWQTVNGTAPSAANGFETTYFRDAARYTVYVAYYPDAGLAGSKTVGLSAPGGQKYSIVAVEILGSAATSSASTPEPLIVTPPWTPVYIPPVLITNNEPLGNPAVPTPQPLIVGPEFAQPPIPGVQLFGPGAPAAAVASTPTPQPLVVSPKPGLFNAAPVPGVTITASQPLGNPAAGSPQPLIVGPEFTWPLPTPAIINVPPDQPGAPNALVISPPWTPVYIPPVTITESQPLGNPAVGSPQPLVVSPPPWRVTTQPQLFATPAAPVISTIGTPNALVVSPTFVWPLVPTNYISASQPLGNPAVPTPQPLIVTTAWLAKVPGAIITGNPAAPTVVSTTTPNALVVTPPAPTPLVPPVRLFAGAPTTFSAQPLLVSAPYIRLPVPGARISANPLTPPAQRTFSQTLVITKPWVPDPGAVRIGQGYMLPPGEICEIPRPFTGTVTRPSTGTVSFAGATVTRPNTGTVPRPNTGIVEDPC
jgi:hypothetical protein